MSKTKSVFLDVDSNILERNLLINENAGEEADFENFLQSQKLTQDGAPWKLVTPKPGICVKTSDDKNAKAFINLCHMEEIPEPKEVSEEELMELWRSDDATDYRIPLSIQEPRDELDKGGNPAVVYDVAVNSNFFKKLETPCLHRSFVLQVALEGIENKFDVELKKEGYIVLKNKKCLGELRPHRIRTHEGPYQPPRRLIEEVTTNGKKLKPVGNSSSVVSQQATSLSHSSRLLKRRLDDGTELLQAEFFIPNLISVKDVTLDVGEDRIVVESRRSNFLADLLLPININEGSAQANFIKDKKLLQVTAPIVS